VLSCDLVRYLEANSLLFKDFRLVDVAFGVYLYPIKGLHIINDDRVRPYRPLPTYCPDTLVQHYLQPEEFVPFFEHATNHEQENKEMDERILSFYNMMAGMGLLKK